MFMNSETPLVEIRHCLASSDTPHSR